MYVLNHICKGGSLISVVANQLQCDIIGSEF